MLPRLLCVVVCVLAPLDAQQCVYNGDSDPRLRSSQDAVWRILFSDSPSTEWWRKTHTLVSRFEFDNVPVLITGLAASANFARSARFDYLLVRMGHTSLDSLDLDFANNVTSSMTTVLEARDYTWPQKRLEWSECGLQAPFRYVPAAGNLLIEVIVSNVRPRESFYIGTTPASGDLVTVFAETASPPFPSRGEGRLTYPKLRLCIDTPHLGYYGEGCAGSAATFPGLGLTGSSRLGESASFVLSNTLPGAPASLLLGLSNAAPLPLDLTVIGMTGWKLYVGDLLSVAAAVADAQGVARLSLTMPAGPEFVGAILYSQYFVRDPAANPFGLVATNYGRLSVGL